MSSTNASGVTNSHETTGEGDSQCFQRGLGCRPPSLLSPKLHPRAPTVPLLAKRPPSGRVSCFPKQPLAGKRECRGPWDLLEEAAEASDLPVTTVQVSLHRWDRTARTLSLCGRLLVHTAVPCWESCSTSGGAQLTTHLLPGPT